MLSTLKKAKAAALKEIAYEKKVRQTDEVFLLFSLGSQFDHLIKQEMEKLGVFCLVADPSATKAEDVMKVKPIGIILSGGPASVYANAPAFDEEIFALNIPILGICLGFQLWAQHIGAKVTPAGKREFSTHQLNIIDDSTPLFKNCYDKMPVLESHGDKIEKYEKSRPASRERRGNKLKILAATDNAPVAAAYLGHLWGVQFHPEVTETELGSRILANFCFEICGAKDKFPAKKAAEQKIAKIKKQVGDKKILLAISGGSDSAIVAYLLKEALGEKFYNDQHTTNPSQEGNIGKSPLERGFRGVLSRDAQQIRAVYIKGIDRPDDEAYVIKYFGKQNWLELKIVDATNQFLEALAEKTQMREKRLAMRGIYKNILEDEAKKFGAEFIAQGTLYTDISESGGGYDVGARKATIKLHHNTGLNFSVVELTPLDDCVKDSGRNIGREIGVPEDLLTRHPFPGPGLVVRIEGEVNKVKLSIAHQADQIYIEELRKWDLYNTVWQAGAVVTQSTTTCAKGDDAASGLVIALWAVWSVNGFTARAAELPYDFLKHVSRRITNEIREVGSVVYRVSDKPPATIEWG